MRIVVFINDKDIFDGTDAKCKISSLNSKKKKHFEK